MYSLEELQSICDDAIGSLGYNREPRLLYRPIEYTLEAGGKRIRPVLLLAACQMFGGRVEDALSAAMAVEVFHNFTLLHDDIMDNAPTRRGRDTVHKKWNSNIAILSGDAMVISSYDILSSSRSDKLPELLADFTLLGKGVCEGQLYDMEFENRNDVSLNEYIEMIRLKTAVLIAGAARMGAIIGGADETGKDNIYRFGTDLGLAFQIQDDLLDTYGNPETFGKEIGGDIAEGKKTFLLITALSALDESGRKKLLEELSSDRDRNDKLQRVRAIYDAAGVREKAQEAIERYYAEAIRHLDAINRPDSCKEALMTLADKLIKRDY